ncbi:type II secretion system minor pseudopilin GspI [Planctobacterium marinum]|uniref:Type II secretion system protein I n=1 Tax=Planctobacterium marinum TaxID=1631968 RepID=A0AA48KQN7_9ALTE|nr:type II secretion system protein GspI [Planctobacterium marinum]
MNEKGLTLLEVMVALFIFALTATSIMKATGEHIRGISTLEEMTMATWVANNELNNLLTERQWPPENNLKGSVELGGRTWHYQHLVTETQDKEFRQVEVIVAQDDKMESVVTSVKTYLSNPNPAPVAL